MREYGWLFTAESARALMAGVKTQSRRLPTSQNVIVDGHGRCSFWADLAFGRAWVDPGPSPAGNAGPYLKVPRSSGETVHRVYPRVWTGDHVWAREALRRRDGGRDPDVWQYEADMKDVVLPRNHPDVPAMLSWAHHRESSYCNQRYMPKWAARIWLEVTSVRIERLQELTTADAIAEGIPQTGGEAHQLGLIDLDKIPGHEWDNRTSVENYAWLWDRLHEERPWERNDFVIAYTFKRIERRVEKAA